MGELKKTISFAGLAVVMVVVALVSVPRRTIPDAFFDVGELFFAEFTDPDTAATLEVVEWNDQTASALPFAVTNRGGLWTIPSHHDYPADGEERLATAAADIINVKKDDFRSDNVTDHAALGVIDPLDDAATSLDGRGTRITFKDASEVVLADLILGTSRVQVRADAWAEEGLRRSVWCRDIDRIRRLDRNKPSRSDT